MLIGKNIVVHTFEKIDISNEYVGWLNNPDVVRLSNQRFIKHNRINCEAYRSSFINTENSFLAVRYKKNQRLIGTVTVYREINHGTADVGIMIGDKSVWGKGVGQEVWDLVLAWLLDNVGVRKVTAGTLKCNFGMISLMERSGMELEAIKKEQEIVDEISTDVLYYAKFADSLAR